MRRKERVSVEVFFSSEMVDVAKLLKDVYARIETVPKDLIEFEPHFLTHAVPGCEAGCGINYANCLGGGRYCTPYSAVH
jgi:hypothetical protein